MSVQKELAAQARARKSRRRHGEPADWSAVDGQKLIEVVDVICKAGGAVRLGYTRDGGAYAIGIYGDGEPYTEYVRPGEDVIGVIRDIADDMGPGSKVGPSS